MADVPPSIGALFQRYRLRAGLSQEALAERAGLAPSAISALERGSRRRPHPRTLQALAHALGLSEAERAGLLSLTEGTEQATAVPTARPAPTPAPDIRPSNLLVPSSSFVGRARELAAIAGRVGAAARLVTLTGPGGAGKTRLAMEGARAVQHHFPDGVWFVDLVPLTDAGLVPQAVAAVLGVREGPAASFTRAITEWLRPRTVLLVLDNCEHLLDACAALVTTLLRACPRLTVITTSRAPLAVTGEQVYPVPLLPAPPQEWTPTGGDAATVAALLAFPAVRLFVDRAQAVWPDFELTAANGAAVAEVCRRLDGLPLALELAAARVRLLAPEQIAARLSDRFRLVAGGTRDTLPRHQTLRALIDWSYDLLTEAEQVMLRRLSVFVGGCTLEAVESVCAGEGIEAGRTLDLLMALVDRSLVVADMRAEAARYRLLESIRAYAAEKLDASGEATVVRARYQRWYLALAETAAPHWHGPDEQAWRSLLEVERDNLRAALAFGGQTQARLCLALRRFWEGRYHSEALYWLDAALAADLNLPNEMRAQLLSWAGVMAGILGAAVQARSYLEEALALARLLGDPAGIATALTNLGVMAFQQADYGAAQAMHEEALALSWTLGRQASIASALHNLGNVAHRQGDYSAARARYEEALALRRAQGNQADVAGLVNNLGNVAFAEGDFVGAQALYEEALRLSQAVGNQAGVAGTLHNLGNVAFRQGNTGGARVRYEEALALRRALKTPAGVCRSLANLAAVALQEGDTAEAESLLREGLTLARELGLQLMLAPALDRLTGEAAFKPAEIAGCILPLEQATAEALEAASISSSPAAHTR